MKKNPLYAQERKQKILDYIQTNARCSVIELAELFAITEVTIRSDLRDLEAQGLIIRTHGGAVLKSKSEHEDFVDERKNMDKKNQIAKKALDFVSDGNCLAIDTGTTAQAFANALIESSIKSLRIITSDIVILHTLEQRKDFEVISIGGIIRHGFHFACGDITLRQLDGFHVDKFFLTTSAIELLHGLSTPNVDTANLKMKMMSIATETTLLSDSTKFDKICFSKIADISQLNRIIIDKGIDKETLKHLQEIVPHVFIV